MTTLKGIAVQITAAFVTDVALELRHFRGLRCMSCIRLKSDSIQKLCLFIIVVVYIGKPLLIPSEVS